jgi:hypothetical protein
MLAAGAADDEKEEVPAPSAEPLFVFIEVDAGLALAAMAAARAFDAAYGPSLAMASSSAGDRLAPR